MSEQHKLSGTWEERWHPLREEWVIIAAHRQNRPWSGETLAQTEAKEPEYVEDCYLCPRNVRVSGKYNSDYRSVYVFDNDHPCVGSEAPTDLSEPAGIYKNRAAAGVARVVCYSPNHHLTLAELEFSEVKKLLTTWQQQYVELSALPEIKYVLIFENKGEAVGVSNPHPHCQIYATNFVFKTIETEAHASARYFSETGKILFQDIIESEKKVTIQLNKGEALHALRRQVLVANEGKLRQRQQEEQLNQALCLNLVINAITVWNTVYMQAALEELKDEGYEISEEDIKHLSPARSEHINMYGKYYFNIEEGLQRKGLRKLRKPETEFPLW